MKRYLLYICLLLTTPMLWAEEKDYTIEYQLSDVMVDSYRAKRQYKRKGNPAVELIQQVIAHKDTLSPKSEPYYTADTYTRASYALENFTPNWEKKLWKELSFMRDYIDTTGTTPTLTISMRENIAKEYYQGQPRREKKVVSRKRTLGMENFLTSSNLQLTMNNLLHDVDIQSDNIEILYNRFVSPLSKPLAVSYYQYYIMDTVLLDGEECIDLAFVPVNSESYSFTGHLYIVNDSTYKVKKYILRTPAHINLNTVSDFQLEQNYVQDATGRWLPARANTSARLNLPLRKLSIMVRQTKLYTHFDFDSPLDKHVLANPTLVDTLPPLDTLTVREHLKLWETLRPEPLTFQEQSVMDLIQACEENPKFNSLIMLGDALRSEYVSTVPSTQWGESKWDFGPIYSTISYNILEGIRLRIGGTTTANFHPNIFLSGYVAFGCEDLRPKYNATVLYSFNKKRYQPYTPLRHYLSLSAQYDAEEPGRMFGYFERDHLLLSIPFAKPVMKNFQYAFHLHAHYYKEWENHITFQTYLDYSNIEAAGAMQFHRIIQNDETNFLTQQIKDIDCYEWGGEVSYSPIAAAVDRRGMESPFALAADVYKISFSQKVGYLDDRYTNGQGFVYTRTDIMAERRFWFSSFGHLDARIEVGKIWNQVPFTKLYFPASSTSIFLAKNSFNLMQPMEFMMDEYLSVYMTYFFKGWLLNRIPGINRLKLRGVVSFAGVCGHLTDKNNPTIIGNTGLYAFPNSAQFDEQGKYIAGYTSSPIGKSPYMELTVGLENIFRIVRIDYIRRLNYNDYLLPDGIHHHTMKGWGRNGVKVSVRMAL